MNAGERVLVVEDDPVVAEIVIAAVQSLPGVEAVHVDDGRRALIRLTTGTWNLVIADIELPGADGLQILEAAKEGSPDVPVILMTAHGELDYAIAAVRGRADEFLVKPIDPGALVLRVEALLAEHRSLGGERAVLAVGANLDALQVGCGGTLLEHRARGDEVVLLTLGGADAGVPVHRAREAARLLGAELVHREVDDASAPESGAAIAAITEQVDRLTPAAVYTHSHNDDHQDHRGVHRATVVATRDVPNVFAYQSPSTGIAFAPTRFVDVTPYMDGKLNALRAFGTPLADPDHLAEDLIMATARYWSRFGVGTYVEPLEVLRTSEPSLTAGDRAARSAGR